MKTILRISFLLALAATAYSQVPNPSIVLVTTAPSGSCGSGLPDRQVLSTGFLYSCQSGTWAQIAGGGGGSSAFSAITSGTNTGQGLVVGSGSVLTTASGGFINANELNGTILSGLGTGPLCNTTGTGVPTICSGGIATSANIYTANGQVQADSIATSLSNGLEMYGDSITVGAGATSNALGYATLMSVDYGLTGSSASLFINNAVAGDNAQDMAWHVFSTANPVDTNNPIFTTAIGTNNSSVGPTGVLNFSQVQAASHTWLGMSSTNKILAGNANVTPTGTTAADTTFTNANGVACTTGPCTFTYTASVGQSGIFYVWYLLKSTGGNLSVTSDGTTLTDTITGSTAVSTIFTVAPLHQALTVGAARYQTTTGSHSLVVTAATGVTIIGFGFPPTFRFRGIGAAKVYMGGVPPQQNNANATLIAPYNAASIALSKLLVSDGLNIPFVDDNANVDPILDWSAVATQNCPASTQVGLHPNNCGHRHLAGLFESQINAAYAAANPNFLSALNFLNVPTSTSLLTVNGQNTASPPAQSGTAFLGSSYCVSTFSNLCWGITALSNGSQFNTYILSNSGSFNSISFSFPAANATPSTVVSAVQEAWRTDGSATLTPGFVFSATAAGHVFTDTHPINAATLGSYDAISGAVSSNTAVMNGLNYGTGLNLGVHQIFNSAIGTSVNSRYMATANPSAECWYTGAPGSITLASQFSCPIWFTSDGTVHASFLSSAGITATATLGTGITSATCATATCTSSRGSYTIVGGTATTGTIVTLSWTATPTAQVCTATQNGGTTIFGIGNSVATTTGFNITAAISVVGSSITVNYNCQP